MTYHFDGKRFQNSETFEHGLCDFLRWRLTAEPGHWQRRAVRQTVPPPRVDGARLQVTFVNHATVLVQTAGLNILTDPVWAERAGPFGRFGPRRQREPGVAFADLPPIDHVLVSHNHFDHMDLTTLRRLAGRDRPGVITPLGNRGYLAGTGNVVEVDWWQSLPLGNTVELVAVPARHWSRRRATDYNRALWAGFYLRTPVGAVYFAGDTSMGNHFAAIRERLGAPLLAMLPIGAYKPRWFMGPVHLGPDEAVHAHRILGARHSMAIHFGTFPLADDGMDEPVSDLHAELDPTEREHFWVPENGESRRFDHPPSE